VVSQAVLAGLWYRLNSQIQEAEKHAQWTVKNELSKFREQYEAMEVARKLDQCEVRGGTLAVEEPYNLRYCTLKGRKYLLAKTVVDFP
jgi:hypothetical protein